MKLQIVDTGNLDTKVCQVCEKCSKVLHEETYSMGFTLWYRDPETGELFEEEFLEDVARDFDIPDDERSSSSCACLVSPG